MLSIITMNSDTVIEANSPGSHTARTARKTPTDSLVADLANEFPGTGSCEIRVAVLEAEEKIWPKRDAYILLDRARELLRRGAA